jgi:hypothetical protein
MEAQGGEDEELLLIHDLGTRWGEWSAWRLSGTLPPGKGPTIPIIQEAGWAPEPVWTQCLDENVARVYFKAIFLLSTMDVHKFCANRKDNCFRLPTTWLTPSSHNNEHARALASESWILYITSDSCIVLDYRRWNATETSDCSVKGA